MSKSILPVTPLPDSHERRFPRSARLRLSSEFLAVRSKGETLQGRYLRITVLRFAENEGARLGVITSRRVGGAVLRNRMRRRVRELFRAMRSEFPRDLWIVVVAKQGSAEAGFAELREEWLRLVRRIPIVPRSE